MDGDPFSGVTCEEAATDGLCDGDVEGCGDMPLSECEADGLGEVWDE